MSFARSLQNLIAAGRCCNQFIPHPYPSKQTPPNQHFSADGVSRRDLGTGSPILEGPNGQKQRSNAAGVSRRGLGTGSPILEVPMAKKQRSNAAGDSRRGLGTGSPILEGPESMRGSCNCSSLSCHGRDSNPHSHYWPRDFKSLVSTIPPPWQTRSAPKAIS
jgi:hypothetical protein